MLIYLYICIDIDYMYIDIDRHSHVYPRVNPIYIYNTPRPGLELLA